MLQKLFHNILENISHCLQISGFTSDDDPAIVYGSSIAIDTLHFCADKIISVYKNERQEDIDILLNIASQIYEDIKTQHCVLAIGFLATVNSAVSKICIQRISKAIKIGFIIPTFNEKPRLLPHEQSAKGQNALQARINQFLWLFSDCSNCKAHMLFVDDLSTDDTKEVLKWETSLIPSAPYRSISVIGLDNLVEEDYRTFLQQYPTLRSYSESIKGGSVYLGLLWMIRNEFDYAFYLDFDLTHVLEHAGLMLNRALASPEIGIVINSRRTSASKGYSNSEPNMTSVLFQTINNELLCTSLTDGNTGYKLVNLRFFQSIAKDITDLTLSFDSELLMLCIQNSYKIIETSGICYHKYVEGKQGVNRDYGKMLERTMSSKLKHNYNMNAKTPLFSEMRRLGFYNWVKILESSKKPGLSNFDTLQKYIYTQKL